MPLTNERIVLLTLSAILFMVMTALCIGLFVDRVDNAKIFEILTGFFNSGMLAYLGIIKVGQANEKKGGDA